MNYLRVIFFLIVVSFSACSEDDDLRSLFPNSTATNYFKVTTNFKVEVHYETGAEPFTGNLPNGDSVWTIVEDNLAQIFSFKSVTANITIPTSLSEMNLLNISSQSQWTASQVVDLYKQNHNEESDQQTALFYIYFLNGRASSGDSVIGFSVSGTPVIAIFKEVVEASGGVVVQRFVEQSTIVHELGHAVGFVNNGVPLSSAHQDEVNGAHTQNSDCVMFWLNEGASDLQSFVQNYIATGQTEMWGPEVLSDAQSFSE